MISVKDAITEDQNQILDVVEKMRNYFTDKEIDLLLGLIKSYFTENKDRFLLKVAIDENKVLGFAIYKKADLSESYWDIYWLVVSPDSHRRKIGTSLLENIEKEVRQNKGLNILIETSLSKKYEPARKLYEKMGYRQICVLEDYYAQNEGKILYRKTLYVNR